MNVSTQSFNAKPFGLSEDELSTLKAIFGQFETLGDVLIFGSRAMGTHKRGSDVDIALMGAVSEDLRFRLRDALEESVLPYFFDVLVYEELENAELKKHIDTHGISIFKTSTS